MSIEMLAEDKRIELKRVEVKDKHGKVISCYPKQEGEKYEPKN